MYDKIINLMKANNVSQYALAREIGIARSSFSAWKTGKAVPKADTLEKIADYFHVPLAYFYVDDPEAVMAAFPKDNLAPVYDCAAGEGRVNGEYATEHISKEASEDYSYIRIHGDSMLPKIQDGDLVKVHHQTETTPSDLTVIKVDGETATLKYVEVTDTGIWVRASNKEVFEDRFFTVKEVLTLPVTIIGKAVELTRSL